MKEFEISTSLDLALATKKIEALFVPKPGSLQRLFSKRIYLKGTFENGIFKAITDGSSSISIYGTIKEVDGSTIVKLKFDFIPLSKSLKYLTYMLIYPFWGVILIWRISVSPTSFWVYFWGAVAFFGIFILGKSHQFMNPDPNPVVIANYFETILRE